MLPYFVRKLAQRFDIYLHLQACTRRSRFEVLISGHKYKKHNVADPSDFIISEVREV